METPRETESALPESISVQLPLEQNGSIGPFCAYVVALLFGDLIGFTILRDIHGRGEFLAAAFLSVVIGQVALAIIVGGLMADNWLEGLFWSMVIFITGTSLTYFAGPLEVRSLRGAMVLPLICFSAALPLILLRWTIGWRLRRQDLPTPPRPRLTIEDMILVPASVAAICVLASGQSRSMSVASWMFLVLPILSLIIILPCTYFAFRLEDGAQRWLFCLGYPLAVVIVAITCIASLVGGFPGDAVGWSVFCTLTASFVAMLGTQILYSNGYRLTGFSSSVPGVQPATDVVQASPFDVDDSISLRTPTDDPLIASSRRRHRIAVGILLAVAVIMNFGFAVSVQNEQRRFLERIVLNGGTVKTENGNPVRIAFGPSTADHTFYQMPSMPTVRFISLAGTQMKTLYLANNLRSLESVDIRDTNIGAGNIGIPVMEIIVKEGQFSDSDIKLLVNRGYSIKQTPE